ncbi:hypothetical protein [Thiolapillus sp.]
MKSFLEGRLGSILIFFMLLASSLVVTAAGFDRDVEQNRLQAVTAYYANQGVRLSREEAKTLLSDQPEIVDLALALVVMPANIQPDHSAHIEMQGDSLIQQQSGMGGNFSRWAAMHVAPAEGHGLQDAFFGVYEERESPGPGGLRTTYESVLGQVTDDPNPSPVNRATASAVLGRLETQGNSRQLYGVYSVVDLPDGGLQDGYGVRSITRGSQAVAIDAIAYNRGTAIRVYSQLGRAGDFYGSVVQDIDHGGIVKAAAALYCGQNSSEILRHFGGILSVSDGANVGSCNITFPYDISSRFFQATADDSGAPAPRGVSCSVDTDDGSILHCHRYDENMAGRNGPIMVTVF